MVQRRVVLFDVDGTLIDTGGAGGRSWSYAFREAFGVDGDIRRFSEVGMTDPVVARETFEGTMGREPTTDEVIRLMMRYVLRLPVEVQESPGYRVMPGVHDLLERLTVVIGDFLIAQVSAGAQILQPPKELDYFAPGYYSVLFEDPCGTRLEVNFVPGKGHLAEDASPPLTTTVQRRLSEP